MTQTDVNIDSGFVASPTDVSVVQGDSFTITSEDADVTLFFSRDCQSLLSPAPGASVALDAGDSLTYTFTSSHSGSYMVLISGEPNAHPHFLPLKSNTLTFTTLLHAARSGGGPMNQLQGQ